MNQYNLKHVNCPGNVDIAYLSLNVIIFDYGIVWADYSFSDLNKTPNEFTFGACYDIPFSISTFPYGI